MKDFEFYRKYSNIPLPERSTKVNVDGAKLSLTEIYFRVIEINDKIRNDIIEKEHLIQAFEWFIIQDEEYMKKCEECKKLTAGFCEKCFKKQYNEHPFPCACWDCLKFDAD